MDYLIHHMLRASAERFPDKEALVQGERRLTYSEVASLVAGLAQGLRELGIKRGERVGIFLDASIEQVISIFAIAQAGAVYVPINSVLFPDQVAHIAQNCGMKALISTGPKLHALMPALSAVSTLKFVVTVGGAEPEGALPGADFDQLARTAVPPRWQDWGISKDLAAILYTSGSTGKPKGVMLSHANVMAGATIVSTYLEITHQDTILAVFPLASTPA